ncbi:hypothetical protein BGM09_01050 [Streptomyces sp. CBMA29]|nr:hypothetical protein [Streptomyces sp. CBMA29]
MRLRFQRKNWRWTTIDVPYAVAPVLLAYIGDRKTGPLIVSDGRQRRNPETGELERGGVSSVTLRTIVKELGVVSGVRGEKLHPHLLRYTSIIYSLRHPDAKDHQVSDYYGHRNTNTTLGYANRAKRLPRGATNPLGIDWSTQGETIKG